MLHIILHIIAIIGIIILCILGLLILLILLVLLCPLRYRIMGSKQDKEIHFSAKLAYLFHIITARFSYPDPGNLEIRIFGIRLNMNDKKDEQDTATDKRSDLDVEAAQEDSPNDKSTEESYSEKDKSENVIPKKVISNNVTPEKVPSEKESAVEGSMESHSTVQSLPAEDYHKQDTGTNFLRHPILWIRNIYIKIYYTLKRLYDKIKHIIQNITYYKDVLTDPSNRALYKRLKDRVLIVLKKVVPRHFRAEVTIGTGSPDTTGYLCGLYGILIPVLGKDVHFTADFEQMICNGYFEAKGHIRLMTILIQATKVYFDKQLRIFIKQLKREE